MSRKGSQRVEQFSDDDDIGADLRGQSFTPVPDVSRRAVPPRFDDDDDEDFDPGSFHEDSITTNSLPAADMRGLDRLVRDISSESDPEPPFAPRVTLDVPEGRFNPPAPSKASSSRRSRPMDASSRASTDSQKSLMRRRMDDMERSGPSKLRGGLSDQSDAKSMSAKSRSARSVQSKAERAAVRIEQYAKSFAAYDRNFEEERQQAESAVRQAQAAMLNRKFKVLLDNRKFLERRNKQQFEIGEESRVWVSAMSRWELMDGIKDLKEREREVCQDIKDVRDEIAQLRDEIAEMTQRAKKRRRD